MWLIKDKNSQILGPFSDEDICQQINSFRLNGDELISKNSLGPWKPLSSHPPFYKELLKVLSDGPHTKTPNSTISLKDPKIPLSDTDKQTIKPSMTKSSSKKRSISRKTKISNNEHISNQTPAHQVKVRKKSADNSVIEMADVQSEVSKSFIRRISVPLIIGALLFYVIFNVLVKEEDVFEGDVQLISPRGNQPTISQEETVAKIKNGMQFFLKDEVSSYLKAQSAFVQVVEGDSNNKLAMAYLCLAYFELWPYSKRSSKDTQLVSSIVRKINTVDQGGVYSALCRSVELLIHEKYERLGSFVQTAISELSKNKNPENVSIFFYYIKSLFQINELNYKQALISLEHVRTTYPNWVRPYIVSGKILEKLNNSSKALKFYNSALKINPQHKTVSLKKGILTYKFLKKYKDSETLIHGALSLPDKVLSEDLAEAYFVLFQLAQKNNDTAQAKKYAEQSFILNPSSVELRGFLSQFKKKGARIVSDEQIKSRRLIEQGDQLEREGRDLEARSYYKMAFKVDDEKNSIAATKMGENLWNFGLTTEAIQWLKKAVVADPNHMPPYILMADYYSQIYDFDNASKILKTAYRKFPDSLDIFKGYALLQLRRNNFKSTISYAQKALALYESDVESYILLSRAYQSMEKYDESLKAAQRVLEIDSNDRQVQLRYGEVLGYIYGVDVAFDYFEKLISNSEVNSKNYIEYILGLSDFLYDSNKYDQALSVIDNLSGLPEKPARYFGLRGQIYDKKDDLQRSYEEFINALSLEPNSPTIMFHLSQTLIRGGRYGDAREYLQRISQSYPRYPKVHYYIARTYFLEGGEKNLNKALKETTTESQLNPLLPDAYQLAGEIYFSLKKYMLCAQTFQKAIELLPDDSELYLRVAECYRRSGYLNLALQMLRSISQGKNRTSNPKVYREMGALYEMKQDYDNARKSYAIYFDILPQAKDKKEIEARIKQFGL